MAKSPDAFRTISEVADWLGIQAHVLRFWESKFTQVKPIKRAGGRRYYRPADMLLLGGIKKLLHEDGLTIKGVQKILREEGMSHVADMSAPLDELTLSQLDAEEGIAAPHVEAVEESGVVLSFAKPEPEPIEDAVLVEDEVAAPEPVAVAEAREPERVEAATIQDDGAEEPVEEALTDTLAAAGQENLADAPPPGPVEAPIAAAAQEPLDASLAEVEPPLEDELAAVEDAPAEPQNAAAETPAAPDEMAEQAPEEETTAPADQPLGNETREPSVDAVMADPATAVEEVPETIDPEPLPLDEEEALEAEEMAEDLPPELSPEPRSEETLQRTDEDAEDATFSLFAEDDNAATEDAASPLDVGDGTSADLFAPEEESATYGETEIAAEAAQEHPAEEQTETPAMDPPSAAEPEPAEDATPEPDETPAEEGPLAAGSAPTEPTETTETPARPANTLPAFLRRPAEAPRAEPPQQADAEPTEAESPETAAADPVEAIEPAPPPAPKPRWIDLPPLPDHADIPAHPAALSNAYALRRLSAGDAAELAPLLDRLTAHRDAMAAQRDASTRPGQHG